MTEEQIKDYTLRITNANETALAVIVQELLEMSLKEAIEALAGGEEELFVTRLKKAQRFLGEMIHSINYEDPVGRVIGWDYVEAHKQLLEGKRTHKREPMISAYECVKRYTPVFQKIAKDDTSAPLMGHAQKVYAGLTYGKTSKLETAVDQELNRGYTV